MSKIKPLYIYLGGIVIALAAIIIVSRQNPGLSTPGPVKNTPPAKDIQGQVIPNDPIHRKLMNPLAQKPSKSNVMPSIMKHMNDLKNQVEQHPNDTSKIRQYADFLTEALQYDRAIKYYKKILKIDHRRIDIMSSLVFIYFNQKNFNSAGLYLYKILAIDKKDVEAMYNLGAVDANMGKKEMARKLWLKIINNYPGTDLSKKAQTSINQL